MPLLTAFFAAVMVAAAATSQSPGAPPSPTLSASPSPVPSPSPSPAASNLRTIGTVQARGRIDNLIGVASSAAEGFVGHSELEERPILRPGELLETVPGVVISQHSGEGKANQYYLRGFNLDHGTDIAITIGGVPANMRTHAHGQGYSDVNWLIPETVNYVNFRKGTYHAADGDFSTAGAVEMTYFNVLPHDLVSVNGGPYGQARILLARSPSVGPQTHLLYALEYQHADNTALEPDNYRKFNGLVRWSRQDGDALWGITAQGYQANWMSSDQIPLRAVQKGLIDRFGQIDPTDGGRTHRYVLSGDYTSDDARSTTRFGAYAMDYGLHLFSDFTYFLNDPVNGDQFNQNDQRLVLGANLSRTWKTPVAENTIGYQFRNDNITPVSLMLSRAQRVIGTTRIDHVVETSNGVYLQTAQHLSKRLRMTAGLRADEFRFRVTDLRPQNSGDVSASILSPKLAFAYTAGRTMELYADFGTGFHSNDARGITERVDPGTGSITDPGSGQIVEGATPLVRAQGAEIGARFAFGQKVRSTFSLWNLNLASELVFQGDAGTTSPGRPSHRFGVEVANFWEPAPGITYDFDYASSAAKFTNFDPVGSLIPGSIKDVLTIGATAEGRRAFGSLRVRYFGPRPLIEAGTVHSNPTTTINVQAGVKPTGTTRFGIDVFNLLNAKASDIDYYYNSSLPSDPAYTKPGYAGPCPIDQCGAGVPDVHFHPIERRLLRLTFTKTF
ncbi:TonB-dependent receptor [Vulcanimicrobium alpinum]|uniref:TonB-dependent receptor n=1 Tax=Vulcanimicrobium alpinum TaxID=3016050 RepID=A0AAN2C9X2_UNVUL|nr:TonB-dependent receptor [Vulcanimicrobium alpinum]